MKTNIILLAAASGLASCTSVFWASSARVPAQKKLANVEIRCEVFDAVGERCTSNSVQVTSTEQGDSARITQFLVPKFSTVDRRRDRVNYLWVVDGRDTSVYELAYRGRSSWAVCVTAGSATLLSLIPRGMVGISPNATISTLIAGGSLLFWGGILVDAPTGIAGLVKESRANAKDLMPRWKLKRVRRLTPEEYPPALVRAVSELREG